MNIPPIILVTPLYKEKIWGGTTLTSHYHKTYKSNQLGESWEVSTYNGDISPIENSPYTLLEYIDYDPEQVLGGTFNKSLPLLFKFIDAQDKLSVQVHPNDTSAKQFSNPKILGKTECWYVLDAKPGAEIICGLKEGTTSQDILEAIHSNSLSKYLNYLPITAGDMLYIPGGTVHAILEDTVIYEIQQSSDTTFRLYDWGRLDTKGNERELHIEEALKVIDTSFHTHHKIHPVKLPSHNNIHHQIRVISSYFVVEEIQFYAPSVHTHVSDLFAVLSCIEGEIEIDAEVQKETLIKGKTVILTASAMKKGVQIKSIQTGSKAVITTPFTMSYLKRWNLPQEHILSLTGNPTTSFLK